MSTLNPAALRQVVYMVVAAVISWIGVDAAGAEAWTTVVMAVIALIGPVMAALNVNKGRTTSPAAPTGDTSAGLPVYALESSGDTQGRHRLEE